MKASEGLITALKGLNKEFRNLARSLRAFLRALTKLKGHDEALKCLVNNALTKPVNKSLKVLDNAFNKARKALSEAFNVTLT